MPISGQRAKIKCLHPSCTMEFVHVMKMLVHLESVHGVDIQRENLTFKNIIEFRKWKENEQATNFVYFTKYQAAKVFPKDSNYMVLYYKCQRDGSQRYHRPRGFVPKTDKVRRSVKTGITCPARMIVKVNRVDGAVAVEYIQSHSHPITAEDSKRQPIPQSLKNDIEAKLISGLSEDEVLTQLTGGSYMPPGKQGGDKKEGPRGDRSSLNYAIPVENGMYFINRKRVSMMKRRIHEQGGSSKELRKKRRTEEEFVVQVATVKGRLLQLVEELNDETVAKSLLPEVDSVVTCLLDKCSAVKLANQATSQPVTTTSTSSSTVSLIQSDPNTVTTTSQPNQDITNNTQPPLQTTDQHDPNFVVKKVYFSDGKNIIQVAIKKRVDPQQGSQKVVDGTQVPQLGVGSTQCTQVVVGGTQSSETGMDGIQKPDMPSLQPAANSTQENIPVLCYVATPVSTTNDAPSTGVDSDTTGQVVVYDVTDEASGKNGDITQTSNEIFLVETTDAQEAMTTQTLTETIDQSVDMTSPQCNESNQTMSETTDQEVVQVIEQPQIIYNLPTEGAYVTVCDVDDSGVNVDSTGVENDLSAAQSGGATILLNAIIAANLNIET